MIDTKTLEVRNECDYYTSYHLPNNNVLYVAKDTITYEDSDGERVTREASHSECARMFSNTFSSAVIGGKEMLRKGECQRFTLQTVDIAKDEPDTGMIVLMTQ